MIGLQFSDSRSVACFRNGAAVDGNSIHVFPDCCVSDIAITSRQNQSFLSAQGWRVNARGAVIGEVSDVSSGATKMLLADRVKHLLERYAEEFTDFNGLVLTDVNQTGYGEDRPLHLAARHGAMEDAALLIEAGALIDTPGDIGLTPLHYAAMRGHLKMAVLLLDAGASLSARNEFGETPLKVAKQGGHQELAELFRRRGAPE